MKARTLAAPAALAVLSFVLFLATGEAVLRFSGLVDADVEAASYAAVIKRPADDPRIVYVQRPDVHVRLMGVDVRINKDGFRDAPPLPVRSPSGKTTIFLGDSITFGWGVEEDATFASLLEEGLAPGEVLNFGTVGYNTVQEVALFHERGLSAAPDAVVVFYFLNDAEPALPLSRWAFVGHARFVSFLTAKTRQAFARVRGRRQTFREHYARLYETAGWKDARNALRHLKRTCTTHDIELRVVLLPDLHDLVDYPFRAEHRRVADFLAGEGLAVLDLAPAFADVEHTRTLWVADDDAHPNAEGHKRIAEAVLPFLKEVAR